MSTEEIPNNVFETALKKGLEIIEWKVSEWLYTNQGTAEKPLIISDFDDVEESEVCKKLLHEWKFYPVKRFGKITIDYQVCKKCFHGYACVYPLKKGEINEW